MSWLAPAVVALDRHQCSRLLWRIRHRRLAHALRRRRRSSAPRSLRKVHPRWHTPHVAILSLGIVATFLLIACQAGDTVRTAYRTIVDLTVIVGFLPYLYVFASAWKAGKWFSAIRRPGREAASDRLLHNAPAGGKQVLAVRRKTRPGNRRHHRLRLAYLSQKQIDPKTSQPPGVMAEPHTSAIANTFSSVRIGSLPGAGSYSCATKPVYPRSAAVFRMKA